MKRLPTQSPKCAGGGLGGRIRRGIRGHRLALLVLILACAGVRIWSLGHDLPHSYYPDEVHFVNRSVAFGSGDLNPHWFHKPAFLMYILFGEYVGLYGVCRLGGMVQGSDGFAVMFLKDPTVFFLLGRITVMLFGLAALYVTYRVGRRLAGRWAGVSAAALLAATFAHNVSSKEVKADVPCAFFTVLSFLFLLRLLHRGSWRHAFLSAAAAGIGMATKYYSIFLLVPMGLVALQGAVVGQGVPCRLVAAVRRALARYALFLGMTAVFFACFFLASPYNYLDSQWYDLNLRPMLQHRFRALGPARVLTKVFHLVLGGDLSRGSVGVTALVVVAGGAVFTLLALIARGVRRPSLGTRGVGYLGVGGILAAAVGLAAGAPQFTGNLGAFGSALVCREGMGAVAATACVAGALVLLARGRRGDLLLLVSMLSFALIASFYQPLHAEPRHLHPLYPMLAAAGGAGGAALLGRMRLRGVLRGAAGFAACLAVAAPGVVGSLRWNVIHGRRDTRTLALHWFEGHIPAGAGVLNDKEAIPLRPNEATMRDKLERLAEELRRSGEGPFTRHKGRLYRYQMRVAQDLRAEGRPTYALRVLDPPWWAEREHDDGSYLRAMDRDLGDPLAERVPKTLAEYRAEGIEYIVTSSKTYRQYTREPWKSKWPSFDRFYRELLELRPIHEIPADPTQRPGPTVRVYRIR